jgi:hypothetical protein
MTRSLDLTIKAINARPRCVARVTRVGWAKPTDLLRVNHAWAAPTLLLLRSLIKHHPERE